MNAADLVPVPELESARSVLCIQPHPDDNEVGAGGTIARLAAAGTRVTYLTVTDGRLGSYDPAAAPEDVARRRRAEAETAARQLGAAETLAFDLPDGDWPDEKALCRRLVGVIRAVRPDFILTCDPYLPYEAHTDHLRVGRAVLEACIFSSLPHFAPGSAEPWEVRGVGLYYTATPNRLVDVTATWERKLSALAAHESQFPPPVLARMAGYLELKAAELGAPRGYARAEAFKVLAPLHLHCFVDALAI